MMAPLLGPQTSPAEMAMRSIRSGATPKIRRSAPNVAWMTRARTSTTATPRRGRNALIGSKAPASLTRPQQHVHVRQRGGRRRRLDLGRRGAGAGVVGRRGDG